jgi:hypothetical protein
MSYYSNYEGCGHNMLTGVGGYRARDHRGLGQELAHEDAENAAEREQFSRVASGPVKIYHVVPFALKGQAKAEGMKWDANARSWYHTCFAKSRVSMFHKA